MATSNTAPAHRLKPPAAPVLYLPPRLSGLLLAFAALLALGALATWSADDPSLSFATDKHAANLLGFPGSAFADLAFQFFGLAAFALVLPPALWGVSYLQRRKPSALIARMVVWPVAVILGAGLLSCFSAPGTWPLPTGLGGLVGMGFTGLAALVIGEAPSGAAAILYGLILAPPTVAALWFSTGITGAKIAAEPDETERAGAFDVIIGAFVHMGFSMRTAFRRAVARERDTFPTPSQGEPDWHEDHDEPHGYDVEPPVSVAHERRVASDAEPRREPRFEPSFDGEDDDPPFDMDDSVEYHDYDEIEPDEPQHPAARPHAEPEPARGPAPNIAAAARTQPGRRAAQEAQGSLLETEGFELPELSLLAEPQQGGLADEHRPERLEAQARQLEGVLEDFGVKGDIIHVRPGPVVTLYELEPAPGIKSSRVISLADDIARSMSAISARVAVVPGRNVIGIELPNQKRETVYLKEMLASADFEKTKGKLNICLGKTIGGEPVIADLAKHAARAGGGHHRFGQVGRHQHDDPVDPLQAWTPSSSAG